MTRLSVNINKLATLRNARGANNPDVVRTALDIERYGAQGITVHPRPDERHIRRSDVRGLAKVLTTEFNIEGYPDTEFIALVLEVRPGQVTLVPDPPGVLTSNAGCDARTQQTFLKDVVARFKGEGIRTSLFMGTDPEQIGFAADTGTERIEAALRAAEFGLGLNAGHDLDRENLAYFNQNVPGLLEVSIGHALICDALTFGLENTVQLYLRCLREDE